MVIVIIWSIGTPAKYNERFFRTQLDIVLHEASGAENEYIQA